MKNAFVSLIFIFILFSVNAQNTWVQKLVYNFPNGYNDTLLGIKQIEVGPDGSYYLLAITSDHNMHTMYKFRPNSNILEWSISLAEDHSSGPEWIESFKASSDSGFVICRNSQWGPNPVNGYVIKYSKDATLQWSSPFPGDYWNGLDRVVYDVIETGQGKYDVLLADTMFTLDRWGGVIDSNAAIHGTRFMELSNSDLLVYSSSTQQLSRMDTLGNALWSVACSGYFTYDTTSVFLTSSAGSVKKIDAITGALIWNRSYFHSPISDIKATYDGGFMASIGYRPRGRQGVNISSATPGYLFRADSLGDTLWHRTYLLPHFGLSDFAIVPGGNILTGGCYFSGQTSSPPIFYSTFCCMMNTDGSYPLAQTDYISESDANHDHFSNWVDDALQTMLALGQTGTPRDSSLDGNGAFGFGSCGVREIAIDWPGSSSPGINSKYADFDGNGVVDTNDILAFNPCYNLDSSIQYYRYGNPDLSLSTEEFCLTPVNDTIQPGENAFFYLKLGNPGNPVDSIYGFAFSCFMDEMGYSDLEALTPYPSSFGTPGIDLLSFRQYGNVTMQQYSRYHIMMCRNDFQNATAVSDTVGLIRFSGYFLQSLITPTIADFKAILVNGTEVPFSVCTGSVYIDSSTVSVHENQFSDLIVFPNPSSNFISVKNLSVGAKKFTILNSLGMHVKEFESSEEYLKINIVELPNGIYTLRAQSNKAVFNSLFLIQH